MAAEHGTAEKITNAATAARNITVLSFMCSPQIENAGPVGSPANRRGRRTHQLSELPFTASMPIEVDLRRHVVVGRVPRATSQSFGENKFEQPNARLPGKGLRNGPQLRNEAPRGRAL